MAQCHSQNLLVELDTHNALTGCFFLRDLEGVSFDLPYLAGTSSRARRLLEALPSITNREEDYDTLEDVRSVERSLHTFFVGGPLHHLKRDARAVFHTTMQRATDYSIVTGKQYAAWLATTRWKRVRPPPVPASIRTWIHREQHVNDRVRQQRLFAPIDLSVMPARLIPAMAQCLTCRRSSFPWQKPKFVSRPWRQNCVVTCL